MDADADSRHAGEDSAYNSTNFWQPTVGEFDLDALLRGSATGTTASTATAAEDGAAAVAGRGHDHGHDADVEAARVAIGNIGIGAKGGGAARVVTSSIFTDESLSVATNRVLIEELPGPADTPS